MTDIDPRVVPIRTAPLWLRRTIIAVCGGPFLVYRAFTSADFDADLAVIDTFWRR